MIYTVCKIHVYDNVIYQLFNTEVSNFDISRLDLSLDSDVSKKYLWNLQFDFSIFALRHVSTLEWWRYWYYFLCAALLEIYPNHLQMTLPVPQKTILTISGPKYTVFRQLTLLMCEISCISLLKCNKLVSFQWKLLLLV